MQKVVSLFVLFLFSLSAPAQTIYEKVQKNIQSNQKPPLSVTQHCRYDSILTYTFLNNYQDSILSEKMVFEFDDQSRWIKRDQYDLSADSILYRRVETTREFDFNGNLTYESEKGYNVTDLTSWLDDAYFYNANGRLDSSLSFRYDFDIQSLIVLNKEIFHYNSLDQNIQADTYEFDQDSQAYFLESISYNYFNSNGQIDSTIEREPNSFVAKSKIFNTYTAFDSIERSVVLARLFGGIDTFVIFDYAYDLQNNVRETWSDIVLFGGGTYERFQFDNNGELLQRLVSFSSFGLTYGDRYDFQYSPNDDCRLTHDYFTGENTNFSDTIFTARAYYFLVNTVSAQIPEASQKPMIFPNPTTGLVFVKKELFSYENAQVMDKMGRTVRTFSGIEPIDLSGMESGMYFIQFKAKEGAFLEKVVLQTY